MKAARSAASIYLVFDNVAAHALGLNDLTTPWFMMDKL
jgi:hypothetical protein